MSDYADEYIFPDRKAVADAILTTPDDFWYHLAHKMTRLKDGLEWCSVRRDQGRKNILVLPNGQIIDDHKDIAFRTHIPIRYGDKQREFRFKSIIVRPCDVRYRVQGYLWLDNPKVYSGIVRFNARFSEPILVRSAENENIAEREDKLQIAINLDTKQILRIGLGDNFLDRFVIFDHSKS
jgi:hypothetical protein